MIKEIKAVAPFQTPNVLVDRDAVPSRDQEVQAALRKWEIALLHKCAHQDATGAELLNAAGDSNRTGNFKRGVEKILKLELFEMTIPDKPRSSKRNYCGKCHDHRSLPGVSHRAIA